METLSWLTQSCHLTCNNLQRYFDNVRYSEETRLRSVSKSFLAAAYPRFESPDTSKDPKRGVHACASVYFGNRYYCHRRTSLLSGFLRLCSTRAARPSTCIATRRIASACASLRISSQVHCPFSMFIQRVWGTSRLRSVNLVKITKLKGLDRNWINEIWINLKSDGGQIEF